MNSQIKLAVAKTEAQARKALQALKNPGQARLRLPLHLRPFLVDTFQYSDRSSLLSDSSSCELRFPELRLETVCGGASASSSFRFFIFFVG